MWHSSSKRSLFKTITYRVLCTTTTFMITYLFTGRFLIASSVAFTLIPIKLFEYYVHERIWDKIEYGREE